MATLLGKAVMRMLPTRSLRRAVVKASSQKMRWRLALPCEEKYWADYISQKGGEAYGADLAERLNPASLLQPHIQSLIAAPEGVTVKILDVGAGPLTVLGKTWPGRTLQITAVDPLAHDYTRILCTHAVTPVVPTRFCEGERVNARFTHNTFDLAYSRNALDHAYAPIAAISAMLDVAKPGGCVLLEHLLNEGETEKYYGLHQWNFVQRNDKFIIWNKLHEIDVAAEIGPRGVVTCTVNGNWLTVVIRKAAS